MARSIYAFGRQAHMYLPTYGLLLEVYTRPAKMGNKRRNTASMLTLQSRYHKRRENLERSDSYPKNEKTCHMSKRMNDDLFLYFDKRIHKASFIKLMAI